MASVIPSYAKNTINFSDVVENSYYSDALTWAINYCITNGISETEFGPNIECNRAQIITFLYRAAKKPSYEVVSNPFEDVKEGDYFYDATLWAIENNITKGTSERTFSPEKTCTRGEIVTFLYRFFKGSTDGLVNKFTDVLPGEYYYEAVLWAANEKITTGVEETLFAPNKVCTRAEAITFIYRGIKSQAYTDDCGYDLSSYPFEAKKNYSASAKFLCEIKSPLTYYTILQGTYTDGFNIWAAWFRNDEYGSNICLAKYDMKGNLVKYKTGLKLQHANCITYIPSKNAFLIAHCQGRDSTGAYETFAYARYSLVNASNFEIIETKVLNFPFFAMAYCVEQDIFASGEWGGQTLDYWDGNLKHTDMVNVTKPESTSQGAFCTSDTVWFPRSGSGTIPTEIRTYDFSGNLKHSITMDMEIECEGISIVNNNTVFFFCNVNWQGTANVYTLQFHEKV